MKRKGAFFFVLDAFIAGIIIVSSLIVVFSSFSRETSPAQELFIADDYISLLSNTMIKEIDDDTVRQWISDKNISSPETTVLNQVAIFYHKGDIANANYLAAKLSSVIPQNKGINLTINTIPIYDRQTYLKSASTMLKSSRIIFVMNQTDILGPDIVEVSIWG